MRGTNKRQKFRVSHVAETQFFLSFLLSFFVGLFEIHKEFLPNFDVILQRFNDHRTIISNVGYELFQLDARRTIEECKTLTQASTSGHSAGRVGYQYFEARTQ